MQYQQSLTSKLSKYLTAFDYINNTLTVFLTVFSGINIFAHVNGKKKQLICLITSVFSLLSALSSGIIKKLHQEKKLRKKKHNRLLYLAKNKLNCVEMLISNSIKDGVIREYPGLILGCCNILQKKIEHINDVICRKIINSASYSFDYSRGTDLKAQFDSNKKHPRG